MATADFPGTAPPQWGLPSCYNFGYRYRGFAVIISNGNFPGPSRRRNAQADGDSMEKLFNRLGFRVYKFLDRTAAQMDEICRSFSSDHHNLQKSDCFALIISTHGEEIPTGQRPRNKGVTEYHHHLYGIDSQPVRTRSLVEYFATSEALKGKPKFFFLQACSSRHNTGDDGYDSAYNVGVLQPQTTGPGTANLGLGDPSGGQASDLTMASPGSEQTSSTASRDSGNRGSEHVTSEWSLTTENSVGDGDDITWDEEGVSDTGSEEEGAGEGHDRSDVRMFFGPFKYPKPDPYDVMPAPCFKDCLVMFASPSGFYALSRTSVIWSGGWLIRSMYEVLKNYDMEQEDFLSALIRVTEAIALDDTYETRTNSPDSSGKRSVPKILHMLTKDVYFIPKNRGTVV